MARINYALRDGKGEDMDEGGCKHTGLEISLVVDMGRNENTKL